MRIILYFLPIFYYKDYDKLFIIQSLKICLGNILEKSFNESESIVIHPSFISVDTGRNKGQLLLWT